MSARPWLKFYPSDWRGSTRLKLVSMAARGLLIEMICIMHEADPYGHLIHEGQQLDVKELADLVGKPVDDVAAWLDELMRRGLVKAKRNGILFNPRMELDEIKRSKNAENGKKGGNPNLRKDEEISGPVNPPEKREAKAQSPLPEPEIKVSSAGADVSAEADWLSFGEPTGPSRVQVAFDAYNAVAAEIGIPAARQLTAERRKKLSARLKESGADAWTEALERLKESPHCRGQNDRGWKADLDFMLQPKSFNRLLEGSYGGRNGSGNGPGPAGGSGAGGRPSERADRVGRMLDGAMEALDRRRQR